MPRTPSDQLPGGQNMAAFLDMLGFSEGTTTVAGSDDGYNVTVGELFAGYGQHHPARGAHSLGAERRSRPVPDHGRHSREDPDRHVGLGQPGMPSVRLHAGGQREHRLELLREKYLAFGGTDIEP
ncbi:hypothetical protein CURE108131_23300 [Cupriavidus respiraculi]|uniref:Uncharacterized protein n=1 Tax=Cupriavidus respiraculi TaxID=195930 RepID=A0ABN7YH40_9BURK|nr:hypothetical protein [Cupriavidus respiraculi]CAG9172323.1 hypothetical protein LMG21510_01936 [Cupriavidus respiraculi]